MKVRVVNRLSGNFEERWSAGMFIYLRAEGSGRGICAIGSEERREVMDEFYSHDKQAQMTNAKPWYEQRIADLERQLAEARQAG